MAIDGEMTLKQMMDRLELITETLEREELELEKSLELFEEGIGLLKTCKTKISTARGKVEKLLSTLDEEPVTESFGLDSEESL